MSTKENLLTGVRDWCFWQTISNVRNADTARIYNIMVNINNRSYILHIINKSADVCISTKYNKVSEKDTFIYVN